MSDLDGVKRALAGALGIGDADSLVVRCKVVSLDDVTEVVVAAVYDYLAASAREAAPHP